MLESNSTIDRLREIQRAAIPARLLKGAEVLGALWRSGDRCGGEWGPICVCASTPTGERDFCRAKKKWLGLIQEGWGGPPYKLPWNDPHELSGNEGFLVLEAMSKRMFEATGLTMKVVLPPARALMRFGPKGTDFGTILDLAKIPEGPERNEALEAVVRIQEVGL